MGGRLAHHLVHSALDVGDRRVRIGQTKGLKDRILYLNRATVEALEAYLAVRGPARTDHVFT